MAFIADLWQLSWLLLKNPIAIDFMDSSGRYVKLVYWCCKPTYDWQAPPCEVFVIFWRIFDGMI